ncbi:p22 protein precursor [Angomonas deanei]|nr:p22 protein precursor [Angomonas deanei]EPY38277.1 p22 protein precursor [Angomonas deanei]|eukprot:EPY25051.1 p22 protein precursor [Angomonas deanei]
MDNGEREEQEYLNFVAFIEKESYPNGGLEFGLTSIDMDLVLDSLTLHPNKAQLEVARSSWFPTMGNKEKPLTTISAKRMRDNFYRGPMISELDEDFSDEIFDYLDERGINNSFANFMMSQAYYLEQEEYLNWLRLLRRFAD